MYVKSLNKVIMLELRMIKTRLIVTVFLLVFAILILTVFYSSFGSFGNFRKIFRKNEDTYTVCRDEGYSTILPLNDFNNYPCLGRDPSAASDVIPGGCVRTVCRERAPMLNVFSTNCVPFNKVSNRICTYDPKIDLVSRFIHENGEWEGSLVNNLVTTLKSNPQLVFLDLGCNIGVYTLAAASINTRSFCVDANYENLRLVSQSVSLGQLHDHVTIIWNALFDHRGEVAFNVIRGNAGASRVDVKSVQKYNMTVSKRINVNMIKLDDLEWLFRGKELFIKMDIEAHDLYVLKGAFDFFKNIDVKFVQMELVENDTFNSVVDLLYSWGYLMFRDPSGNQRLDRKDFVPSTWPGDVYFIKLSHLHRQ